MAAEDAARSPRARRLELAAAGGLLLWRALAVPLPVLWRDAAAWVAVAWALAVLVRDPRRRSGALTAVAAFLLGLYVQGQAPHALRALGLLP